MLKVKTLGGFQIYWDDELISLGKQTNNNIIKLFLLLLTHQETGITRRELLHYLFYAREMESDLGANLRITVYRLRQALKKQGVPCDEKEDYIILEKGVYHWNPKIPVELDITDFLETAKKGLAEMEVKESFRLCSQALSMYYGEYLPFLSTEEWVNSQQTELNQIYKKLFEKVFRILSDEKEYQQAYELAERAASLYPYEEYQVYMIDCLMTMNRSSEALRLYEETANQYFQEMGLEVSETMKDRFQRLSNRVQISQTLMEGIKEGLEENGDGKGPYYCALPSFIDNYRFVKRLLSRTGQSAYVAVVVLKNSENLPLEPSEERSQGIAAVMEQAIGSCLRKGDIFTKYNLPTFLILLMCTSEEGAQIACQRMMQGFRENCSYKKVKVSIRLFPVQDIDENSVSQNPEGNGSVVVCINRYEDEEISGLVYNQFENKPIEFTNFANMLDGMNDFFDSIGYPQRDTLQRTMGTEKKSMYNVTGIRPIKTYQDIAKERGSVMTLVLRVEQRQRSSWQGVMKILENGREYSFISELQVFKVIRNNLARIKEMTR